MTTSNPRNTLSPRTRAASFVLLSAAFVLHAGGARAADRTDAQTQARALLSGATADRSTESNALPDVAASTFDAQEQARRLILGTQSVGRKVEVATARPSKTRSPAGAVGRNDPRAHADAQEMARRVILGTVI